LSLLVLFFDGPVGEPEAAGTTERGLLLLALGAEEAMADARADVSFSRCLALARKRTKKTRFVCVAACQRRKEGQRDNDNDNRVPERKDGNDK